MPSPTGLGGMTGWSGGAGRTPVADPFGFLGISLEIIAEWSDRDYHARPDGSDDGMGDGLEQAVGSRRVPR